MTTPTLAELLAQQEALTLQIEAQEVPALTAIGASLDNPAFADALAVLEAQMPSLTGERLTQANNLVTVLNHCPKYLADSLAAIEARQAAPPVE